MKKTIFTLDQLSQLPEKSTRKMLKKLLNQNRQKLRQCSSSDLITLLNVTGRIYYTEMAMSLIELAASRMSEFDNSLLHNLV